MKEIALLNLAKKLGVQSEGIQSVRLACDYPEEFVEKFSSQLSERGIEKPSNCLPWIALVDTLIEEGLAEEIDWKESLPTICEVVDNLLRKKHLLTVDWPELNEKYGELYSDEALEVVQSELENKEITLAYLDIDSDSFVLITVKKEEIEELKELSEVAGFSILDKFN